MNRFNNVATINAPRSKFHMPQDVKTSASVGSLYPVYVQEIYPGDTFKCETSFVARLSSSYLRPVMDNLFVDFYYFFVPARLCYDKWAQIFGENAQSKWAQEEPVSAPVTQGFGQFATQYVHSKSVADYMGLPVGNIHHGTNIIPFRAFAKIYDDWFRDENNIDPMHINTGEFGTGEMFSDLPWAPNNYTGMLPKVAKFHDVFTSALPSTQKSLSPVGLDTFAPLIARQNSNGGAPIMTDLGTGLAIGSTASSSSNAWSIQALGSSTQSWRQMYGIGTTPSTSGTVPINQTNLGADLSVLTVPDLRYAFQLQRILERSARQGSRYTEYILSAFGTQSPDARLQRSEYLGGKRMPLSTQQVAQTTRGENENDELGSLGAFSLTNGQCGYSKGFTEHGFVIGVMCIRQKHTYQQGIEKFWQRSHRFSYYDPALAHISEQPVYATELFADANVDTENLALTDKIFGYQEAWYDLRFRNDLVTGDMRSSSPTSLDIWHYGDKYENRPTLNRQFIEETPKFVDRTIAVPSSSLDQFIFDIYHDQYAIRRLPAYSTPGLIDHY